MNNTNNMNNMNNTNNTNNMNNMNNMYNMYNMNNMNNTNSNGLIKMSEYGFNDFFNRAWEKIVKEPWIEGNAIAIETMEANEMIEANEAPETKIAHVMPGRIISDYGQKVRLITPFGEVLANRPPHMKTMEQQLSAGDWVVVHMINNGTEAVIEHVLERMTKFSRAAAGVEVKEQIVAANIDTIFLIQSLNKDFNMRRLERYLIAAWESGAVPVVVLTKSDLCENTEERLALVEETAPGVEIFAISNLTGDGIEALRKYISTGKTIALLGSSGVGKSTLVNTLTGMELLKTQGVREDDSKGRHTTTHRELVKLPEGGLILDTPGMRTLSLWEVEEGMEKLFGDIEMLIKSCRFNDCKHQNEPGCAVREGIRSGSIDAQKWQSWLKLQKEFRHLDAKKNSKIRAIEKLGIKKFSRQTSAKSREREGYGI